MKVKITILLYSLLSVTLYGQKFAVSADKMNVAYIGVDNPLTIVAEGYSCSQLEASCENGTLTKTEACSYNFKPTKEGSAAVSVSVKTSSGLKHIGLKKFRVKLIPDPTATIAGKVNGLIAMVIFKAQMGILVNSRGFDFDCPFKITAFKIEFFRNTQLLYSGSNAGPAFNVNILNAMKSLKPGDEVSVSDIKAVGPDARTRTLNEITLRLN